MTKQVIAKDLVIQGIVQGVGFRPFLYRLAGELHLKGDVANTSSGVMLHIEGTPENIDTFFTALSRTPPPLAHITRIIGKEGVVKHVDTFRITESRSEAFRSALISPDICVCDDCLREFSDPADRRYQYPFINCTNCGPRYTIIDNIPYDRKFTSMKQFAMCELCRQEYNDPENRRFHAQPNACPDCGPGMFLYDNRKNRLQTGHPARHAADLMKKGSIVAVKGLGGFHLAVDGENRDAVDRLRARKHREEKPFALMARDMDMIRCFAEVTPEEASLLSSPRRPIVILQKKFPNTIAESVSPESRHFGVMLPYTPIHYLLFEKDVSALVMTSGNLSDEPIAIDNDEAFDRLGDIADYFLMHDRDIYLRSDDAVLKAVQGKNRMIRRSRGYVPAPVTVKDPLPRVLACGGELKNTICLTKDRHAFLSQHIGDLENMAAYDFFRMTIDHMKRILDIHPELVAHDLHPDYLSTRYALEQQGIEKIGVQHHHAHIASCMSENHVHGPVIGLAFDGTGYGPDGSIWGGEVFLVRDFQHFERAAHLSCVSMPGSAAAVREPWRMAVSYLFDAFGDAMWDMPYALPEQIPAQNLKIMAEMIRKNINCPRTSSLGRLFDAVASMINVRHVNTYEGQAAVSLEMIADKSGSLTDEKGRYDAGWSGGDCREIDVRPVIRGIADDLKHGVEKSRISAKFHATLIHLFSELCLALRRETGLDRVVCSGGVLQNDILLTGLCRRLEAKGFQVFTHSIVPANDGGLALGQAVIAAATASG